MESEPSIEADTSERFCGRNMFAKQLGFCLSNKSTEALKCPKHHRTRRDYNLNGLGPIREYVGAVEQLPLNEHQITLEEAGWSKSLIQNFEVESDAGDPERSDFLNIMLKYMDLHAHPSFMNYTYRTVYLAHVLNHIICTRNCIITNNRKLNMASAKSEVNDELIESTRDQGFVRPTVLILCPFKKDAYDIVSRLERLFFGKDAKVTTWSRERFHNEFKSEVAPVFKTKLSEEFKDLISGNNDDCFRVGIALSKKILKLYEAFEKSDLILCSPLGLRMILDGDAGKESHLISNIQIAVVDKADIMLQQNWEHLALIFSHLNNRPSKIDADIARVRQLYIDGLSKHYCQLLLFSRYAHELFLALILEHSMNYRGLIIQNRPSNGTLDKIEIPLCQEFRRFSVKDGSEQAVLRFENFKQYCSSSILPGTCVVIPSYFDFVRVRNYFKRTEESFVACHEYAPKNKITRARDMFYHNLKKILLVTERYYYFNRRRLRGISKIVFYQLPSHPDFYSEFINMANYEDGTRLSSVLFYCNYDRIRLQNTFGTDLANSIMSSEKMIQAIVSE
ncbi:hypothetical protein DICVIV_00769 [Dictyocaulus viviparus]|uniref:U3 small nucleolar RNA-associated protein 25 homolog n=1 Tax=Dictyocaulus viviparus TaxID=29172 RepID=A0A0D8YAP2_DICVI|nr:hypothetical protein DICVIV_00769 [Dictyocaulus viviparus]